MISSTVRCISGRKCLLLPSRSSKDKAVNEKPPPLVLLGGMAQTLSSWEHHLYPLSRDRDVLMYECYGQGLGCHGTMPEKELYANVSLEFQVKDFVRIVTEVFSTHDKFDFAGFSFGGRVGMAVASTYPHMIRKLHLTGVSARRDEFAQIVLSSWKDLVRPKNYDTFSTDNELIGFAWSIIMTTYSEEFLVSCGSQKIRNWVQHINACNTSNGLYALIDQTNSELKESDHWHPLSIGRRVREAKEDGHPIDGKIYIGSKDKLATFSSAQDLSRAMGFGDVHVYDGCGHAVPMENARVWRNDLIQFLNH